MQYLAVMVHILVLSVLLCSGCTGPDGSKEENASDAAPAPGALRPEGSCP